MKPRVSVITKGEDDLESAMGFCSDGLGWDAMENLNFRVE